VRHGRGHHDVTVRTVFGNVELHSPRLGHCPCRWWGFHADVSPARGRLGADLVQIVLQDGDAAVEAALAQSLENHNGAGVRVLFQQFPDGCVKRFQLAGALRPGTWLRRAAC